jgi:hypothetical protein
VPPPPEGY